LAEQLLAYNRVHPLVEQIRLRMALHAGEVYYDEHGVTGAAINLAFRLLDAYPLKAALAESPGVLAIIVSSWFFDEVVRQSDVANPASYRPIRVAVKETNTVAWISVPGHPHPAHESVPEASLDDIPVAGHGTTKPTGTVSSPAGTGRRPWMAPPLDRMVERPDLADRLVEALTNPETAEVGLTTGLHGVGGFGKTTLATWICHHEKIRRCYAGGLLWVTVGQEVHGTDLAERINDLAFALSGQRPMISSPEAAGAELGRLLDDWDPVLLIIDDIWTEWQLRPFRFGGRCCTRLVTSRVPDLLPSAVLHITVDAMSGQQAAQLVSDGVDGLPADLMYQLATATGRWPVLLSLVNGVLRRRVARGQAPVQAADQILRLLADLGPTAFDPSRPTHRERAVAATMEASLKLLSAADRERYLDLAIFPEDVQIPLDVLRLLWAQCRVETVCEDLIDVGLITEYRLDAPGPRLTLHDVIRAYLRNCRSTEELTTAHRRLLNAAKELLPNLNENGATAWWRLPASAGYLWRFLTHHLHEADQPGELAELVCDLRWVEEKTRQLGSALGVETDLARVNMPTAITLRAALRHAAHLLGPIEPPIALGSTLASRLHSVSGLDAVVDRYKAQLPRPRLEPKWPLPDRFDPNRPVISVGHTGGVTACAFAPDGALLATASDDQTVRLWRTSDGIQQAVLTGHTQGVWGCAFSPDGSLLASACGDGTTRLWRMPDGSPLAVLAGHGGLVTGCSFAPSGILLATASNDKTARLWSVADGACRAMLTGHTGRVNSCTFSPDGTLLATASDDQTVRLWRTSDGIQQAVLTGHTQGVWGCAFSPDGSLLASACGDGTIRLWRTGDGKSHAVITGHSDRVTSCAFAPASNLLASTSHDGTVRLWRVLDGTPHAVLTGHSAWVRGCAFSADGTLLVRQQPFAT
jgi:hypothetical protein